MEAPSRKTVLRLYAMSGNACAFPKCTTPIFSEGANLGEVCHIRAHRDGGKRYDAGQSDVERHSFENLILLCCNHHKKVDDLDLTYTVGKLEAMKLAHEAKCGRDEEPGDVFIAKRLSDDLERRIAAEAKLIILAQSGAQVTVKTGRVKIEQAPLEGSVGANPDANRYIRYLIDKYHKFASADRTRVEPYRYARIHQSIKTKFRAKWDHLPIAMLPDLYRFLQGRIDATILGKVRKSKGQANYRDWSTYIAGFTINDV
mgnify:CR=1 FL=1|jgi:hypothetical protein